MFLLLLLLLLVLVFVAVVAVVFDFVIAAQKKSYNMHGLDACFHTWPSIVASLSEDHKVHEENILPS